MENEQGKHLPGRDADAPKIELLQIVDHYVQYSGVCISTSAIDTANMQMQCKITK